jgi:hypothetical protein
MSRENQMLAVTVQHRLDLVHVVLDRLGGAALIVDTPSVSR